MRKIIRKLFFLIFGSYTGFKIFNLLSKITGYKIEKRHFFKSVGYYPNIKNPQSFNEKVLWKILYDRNPLLPIVTDKYIVRKYIKDTLGNDTAEKILIPLFYVTDKPETIPFDDLPEEYIIKPNHANRKFILAENIGKQKRYTIIDYNKTTTLFDSKEIRKEIISVCEEWLSFHYGFRRLKWAYQPMKHKIIIEKLLRDNSGKIPSDYKFLIFHSRCQLIQVFYDRLIDLNRGWYTPEWRYLNIRGAIKQAVYKKKPDNLKSMMELAEFLGKPFDLIRVDLFSVNNRIYFGELTNYPQGGRTLFDPASFDFELGSKWKITPKYWK